MKETIKNQAIRMIEDQDLTHWSAAHDNVVLAALRSQPASQYLCNATRFKVAVRNGEAMLPCLPDELGGRWVALVAAEDDCHLRAQPDHSELMKNAARYQWLREQHWSDSKFAVVSNPNTAVNLGSICPSRELLDQAIDQAMSANALEGK